MSMSLLQDHLFSAFFTRLFPFDDSCTHDTNKVRAHYDFANVTFHLVSRRLILSTFCAKVILLTLTLATNLQMQCIFKTIYSFHHTLQGCKIDQNKELHFANIQRTLFFFTDIVFARFNILVAVAAFCRMLSFWFELSAGARQSRAKPVIELVITCWSL